MNSLSAQNLLQNICLKGMLVLLLAGSLLLSGCKKETQFAPSEPYQINRSVNTNIIHVGDRISYQISISHPVETTLTVPTPGSEKEIVLLERMEQRESLSSSQQVTHLQYQLTSFRTGAFPIVDGPLSILKDGSEIWTTNLFGPVIEVNGILQAPDKDPVQQDIRGLADWKSRLPGWFWPALLVLVCTLIVALLARRFLTQPRTILQQPPPEPPHERALRLLRRLKEKDYISNGNFELFYVELSNIVRHYIEDRFHLRAPELTTEEFIREAIQSKRLSSEHQKVTADFLEQSDLVKFARHTPQADDMRTAYDTAEHLVKETIPKQTAEEAS